MAFCVKKTIAQSVIDNQPKRNYMTWHKYKNVRLITEQKGNNMKNIYLKSISLVLAGLLSMSCLPACSESTENLSTDETQQTASVSEASQENASAEDDISEETSNENWRMEVKDSLPSDLDFDGSEVRVFYRNGDVDTAAEFSADELTGEVVNDAVFNRNNSVQERLNIKMVLSPANLSRHNGGDSKIRPSIKAGSNDYDLIANHMYNTMPMIMEGLFLPLNKLDYIEFSQPWYNSIFTEESSLNGNTYAVMGDLGQTMISGAFVMFFNKSLLDEYFNGEINLYETVNEGKWTLDEMTSICSQVYTDTNGNGEADEEDVFGHFFTDTKTLGADSFYGAAKLGFFEKNDEGKYVYKRADARTIEFTEKMHKLLFEDNNTIRTPNNDDTIMDMMLDRHTVFTTWMLSGINYLRDMEDSFGIIPMPKLDEEQDIYTAYTHDGSYAFTIPVTEQNPDMVAAFLEAMSAESYRTVTPAYFETAIKSKYSRDSETAQMLDLVVSGIYLDFSYIFGQSLSVSIDMARTLLSSSTNCENAASTLEKSTKSANKAADKVIDKFAKLLEEN